MTMIANGTVILNPDLAIWLVAAGMFFVGFSASSLCHYLFAAFHDWNCRSRPEIVRGPRGRFRRA